MRFLITPEIDGIGIYPCSINARILTKPLLKSRPVNRLLALDHGRSGDSRLGDGRAINGDGGLSHRVRSCCVAVG
jgi:hypothetical protein